MTSIGILHPHGRVTEPKRGASALQEALLVSGVVSALLYISVDLLGAALYPGYSLVDQAISELSAIGAPTKGLWSAMGSVYGILTLAFAIGVLRTDSSNRALRITGWLLVAFAASGVLWFVFPMHQRGTELTSSDVGHIVLGGVMVALILAFVIVGAFTLGRRFRRYSLLTALVFLATGLATFTFTGRVAAAEPTPWLGAVERVSIYSYLLWIAVFAVALLRRSRAPTDPNA